MICCERETWRQTRTRNVTLSSTLVRWSRQCSSRERADQSALRFAKVKEDLNHSRSIETTNGTRTVDILEAGIERFDQSWTWRVWNYDCARFTSSGSLVGLSFRFGDTSRLSIEGKKVHWHQNSNRNINYNYSWFFFAAKVTEIKLVSFINEADTCDCQALLMIIKILVNIVFIIM